MFAGRKLLIADDSPYYRTVIGLTFRDEGMEVTTAEDGLQASEMIEQSPPDVILAAVSIPAVNGYELCRLIKQSERFGHIPVMLLAGLHEPFDQAEARRVGADDVVTKPFKSIRQLVDRVGSLLGGKAADTEASSNLGHSTLGLDDHESYQTEPAVEPSADRADIVEEQVESEATRFVSEGDQPALHDEHNMTDVKVFVEAPLMAEHVETEPAAEPAGSICVADIATQTADTQQLQRIVDEPKPADPISYEQADTMELPAAKDIKPAIQVIEPEARTREPEAQAMESLDASVDVAPDPNVSLIGTPEMHEQTNNQTASSPAPAVFNDGLLDLGEFESPTETAAAEDLILDLDYEEPAHLSAVPEVVPEAAIAFAPAAAAPVVTAEPEIALEPTTTHEEQHEAELNEWAIVTDAPAEAVPAILTAEPQTTEADQAFSPAVIDAIARRAVELLSDKAVREIAWEVVPELAELLIKQKLEEQK